MTIASEDAWLKSLVKKPKVLIVDDDEMVVSILARFCDHMGIDSDTCPDAQCALRFYEENPNYSAILIDIRLGEIGGDEVFKRIRSQDHNTPIAIVSGYLTDSIVNSLMEYGPVTFIKKPIDFNSPHLAGFFRSIGVIE